MPKTEISVLCLGDIVGRDGRKAVAASIPGLRRDLQLDLIVANGENASGGLGLDSERARELLKAGVDILTLGDHTWNKKDLQEFLAHSAHCIRPANYPMGAPGKGWTIWKSSEGVEVGVINLLGRVFMNFPLDCPFGVAEEILKGPLKSCKLVICDMHAEATSEKWAMGRFLDGRASLVFGTHTHVQTADEQILPGGTAYISDLGMCGPITGIIGMSAQVALDRFLTGLPHAYQVAEGESAVNGVHARFDTSSGKALEIKRVSVRVS